MIPRAVRSELSVPASNPRMIAKGLAADADLVFLDLEDSVAPAEKSAARANAIEALLHGDWRGKPPAIRINALDTPFCYRDLVDVVEAAGRQLALVVVPKVDRVEDIHFVVTLLAQIERQIDAERPIGLEAQIETAAGLVNCEAIARAHRRVEALTFGPGDFAASVRMPADQIGVPGSWDERYGGHRWHYPMSRIVVAARAAGIRVLDGPYAAFRDDDGLRLSATTARALGFDGKWCIHPNQIDLVNEIFSPMRDEIDRARQLVAAYDRAMAAGQGALTHEGSMIDAASLRTARSLLALADHVEESRPTVG